VAAYFIYRINSAYDGFDPSKLRRRAGRGILRYNWGAHVEDIERGDIVLTYFTGNGFTNGIYSLGRVTQVNPAKRRRNVTARLLYVGANGDPLIARNGNEHLFEHILTRRRGAEVVVPTTCERLLYRALARNEDLLARARRHGVELPGESSVGAIGLSAVPLIKRTRELATDLRDADMIAAYWIRPRQASWLQNSPESLTAISNMFRKFKAGDMSHIEHFAAALARQVRKAVRHPRRVFGAVVGVPLNTSKQARGEVDRVGELAHSVADELRVPYCHALRLDGRISRRLFKLAGRSIEEFRRGYLSRLHVRKQALLRRCAEKSLDILLVDDVYTDGVTTGVVREALHSAFLPYEVNVRVATLGLMTKQRNMDERLVKRWR